MSDLNGNSMIQSLSGQPDTPERPKKTRRFLPNKKILATAVAGSVILAGVANVAAADSADGVSFSELHLSAVKHTYAETDTITGGKVILFQFSPTAQKLNLKSCKKVNTFEEGRKKMRKAGDCFTVMKNGSKFTNTLKRYNGAEVEFNDYVGSSDSKAGTISATFYIDSKGVLRKGNCKNKVGKVKKLNLSVSAVVETKSKNVVTVKETLSQKGTLSSTLNLSVVCTGGASAHLTFEGSASVSTTTWIEGSASSYAKAKAKATGNAGKLKIEQTLTNQLKLDLKTKATADVKQNAKGHVECTNATTPPTQPPTETPTPTPTPSQPTETPTPTPTPTTPVETPTPTPTPTPTETPTPKPTPKMIPVCDLSSYTVISIPEDQFDSSKYSRDTEHCVKPTPPVKSAIVDINIKNDVDQTSIDQVTGDVDYSTAPFFFSYELGIDSANVIVTSDHGGQFRNAPTSVTGKSGIVKFDYVAPTEPGTDTITVTLKDPKTGATLDTKSTTIKINDTSSGIPGDKS